MKRIALSLFFLFTNLIIGFGQQEAKTKDGRTVLLFENGSWVYADSISRNNAKSRAISQLEIPKIGPKDLIVKHTGYSLVYNEAHEQANWVAYVLTKEKTNKQFERTNKFLVDPKITTGSADANDYKGSGYDRGHLAPASDMGYSDITMTESFYYSNMSPQRPEFNRGIWKKLEELVRKWAIENGQIYIVTGPVLTQGLPTIGGNKVSVPNYYYKVILDYSEPDIKGIGFILPNAGSSASLQNFAVSIDSVEKFTGIDFFPNLPNEQETEIEKTVCLPCWTWSSSKRVYSSKVEHSNLVESKLDVSVQCKGITKAGNHCKNKTLNPNGYCHVHQSQNRVGYSGN